MAQWTVQQSRETYNIAQWGDGFFDIDAAGHVVVSPHSDAGNWSLADIVKRAQEEGLRLPLLSLLASVDLRLVMLWYKVSRARKEIRSSF